MYQSFIDSLIDSLRTIPLLLIIYIGIELAEFKFGNKMREKIQKAGFSGPAIGAVAGSLPQCGISVVATTLYTQRLLTLGTLLAVYLSTSDEAIPIILSQPSKATIVLPLILIKIFIALIAGYSIDFFLKKRNERILKHIKDFSLGKDEKSHNHSIIINETACCGHSTSSGSKKFNPKEIFLHPMTHTLKIFAFIFLFSFLINIIVSNLGTEGLHSLFLKVGFLQPFIISLIGLIPNCASSVLITELYLNGVITYGSVIAGLCASGGLGILILFKEEKSKRDVFKIIALLFVISVLAGMVIQYILKI
ncbi:MAG TPA: putative manganese transporter [Patescibacteria group bacterium]|nr:putative manganese transporter [Patescibacteria group bacterium]